MSKYFIKIDSITKNIIRWGIILVSLFIVILILWNTYVFFQKFKEEERIKMEILAGAYKKVLSNQDLDADISFETKIISSNSNIPMIWTDDAGNILEYQYLDDRKARDVNYLTKQLNIMKAQNEPLEIKIDGLPKQYVYYKDSDILTNLKYYPLGLVLVLVFFSLVLYLYNHSNRIAAQNKLWTGMAKETAHQIGTPLTSLLGWITILKENEKTNEIGIEIEKDVSRLEVIANRFSKIGSEPVLADLDLVEITKNTFDYLESRSSESVKFDFQSDAITYHVKSNPELISWVIENLVKNAIDAMQGKGNISILLSDDSSHVFLKIKDNGKGIPKKIIKKIFEPGFTTKKRGWGLGLSLTKRIVEDFHNGKISVLETGEKGTTLLIKLPK